MKILAIAICSILFSVAAQFSLKAGMSSVDVRQSLALPFTARTMFSLVGNVKILMGFLLYGLGAVIWLAVLSKWDVSKAYPLVGLGFVLSLAVGFLIGEQITTVRAVGVIFICLGIVLVASS